MWLDIEQNTEEWFSVRLGKVTGSAVSYIMANYGKAFGNPAKKYADNIAVEIVTGERVSDQYYSPNFDRGHEEEPLARAMYERKYFVDVTNGGFFDNGETGCSPDGIVGEGMIEIKSAQPNIHLDRMRRRSFESAHRWQLLFNLKESGLEWIDFVSYCSIFPEKTRLFDCRIYAEDCNKEFSMIDKRLALFKELVAENKRLING